MLCLSRVYCISAKKNQRLKKKNKMILEVKCGKGVDSDVKLG